MEKIYQSLSEILFRLKVFIRGSRASDKVITCAGDDEFPLSASEVMSIDDLLAEVLLRLPVMSTLLFKSVSKCWLFLITDPSFILRRSKIPNPNTPSGLFIQKPPPSSSSSVQNISFEYYCVPLDITTSPKFITAFPFGSQRNVEILQSCNGLLLCRVHPRENWVYNPSLNESKRIPQRTFWEYSDGVRLVFDPTISPHYRVMYAALKTLYCYSSRTHNWNDCGEVFSFLSSLNFSLGVYCNDAIHWLDVNGALHYRLDVNRLMVTSIPTPLTHDAELYPHDCKLFAFGNSLFLVCIVSRPNFFDCRYLEVYEMRNGYSEWSLKYQVSLGSITRKFTKTWKLFTEWLPSDLLGFVVGVREEDSFLVIRLSGHVVKYKFVSNCLCVLFDLGYVPAPPSTITEQASCFPFIASFAEV